jgi:hypothetical protein
MSKFTSEFIQSEITRLRAERESGAWTRPTLETLKAQLDSDEITQVEY